MPRLVTQVGHILADCAFKGVVRLPMVWIFLLGGCHLLETETKNTDQTWAVPQPTMRPIDVGLDQISNAKLQDVATESKSGILLASAESADQEPLELGIHDAAVIGLLQNPHLKAVRYIPAAVQTSIEIEKAEFDPLFSASSLWTQSDQQVQSAVQGFGTNVNSLRTSSFTGRDGNPSQLNVAKRWSSGTVTRFGYGTTYNFNNPAGQFLLINPAWQSALNLSVEQPLFQGASREINLLGIRIAELAHGQSIDELLAEVHDLLLAIQTAYWEAYRAQAEIESLVRIVETAEKTWKREDRRAQIGDGSVFEASQARENLESLRVALTESKMRSTVASNQLRQLLGNASRDRRPLNLIEPPVVEEVQLSIDEGLVHADFRRPELLAQRKLVAAADFERKRSRDALRPQMSAIALFGLTGLNNSVGSSIGDLSTGDFGDWSVGLTYQYPLGRRAEFAAVQRAEMEFGQQLAILDELESRIQHEVLEAYDSATSSYQVLESQRSRHEAARLQFETQQKLYESGALPLDHYVRATTSYADAQRELQSALIDYNITLARWKWVTGEFADVATLQDVDVEVLPDVKDQEHP